MIDKKWTYIASHEDPVVCAKIYDKMIIYMNGLSAKTNFAYKKSEIEHILDELDGAGVRN